jgi:signal transduction histidine kinase
VSRIEGDAVADVEALQSATLELGMKTPEPGTPAADFRADNLPDQGRVLVVDNDEINRYLLRKHLDLRGYEVDHAASGWEALAKLRSEPFDAALLDLMMPGMSGFQVLAELKADTLLRDIPVLVLSAREDLAGVADSIKGGAEDYLFKPFDPVLLDARLSTTLERKRLRDQERQRNAELEQVSSALRRSNEDLRRFAYAASHDLQAPVRTVNTYLQLLERRLGNRLQSDEREMIGYARGAAKRMHTLIQDLLSYSRASTEAVHVAPLDCEELLGVLVNDLRVLIDEAGAAVSWDHPLPVILADATAVRQILQNLIGNAIKYRRDESPRVHITIVEKGDLWRFCVRDNGQGIAPEHTKRIFEMFQRLHGDDLPGSGIGLAICQRLVDRFGGKIWVDSEVGRGSVFCFTLPFQAPR